MTSESVAPSLYPKYRSDIDGLRAVSVIGVVVFHAFPKILPGGFCGVDIFFVISGFLISTIIINSVAAGEFSFMGFYSRRVRRIFPALLVMILACLACGWFVLLASEYKQLGKHAAASAAFVANISLIQESGYFDNAAETKVLNHIWSLGVEEQFYFIWPVMLFVSQKLKINAIFTILFLCLASFVMNIFISQDHSKSSLDFFSPQTRFWELLIGALVASIFSDPMKDKTKTVRSHLLLHQNFLSFAGMLLVLASFFFVSREMVYPGWWAVLPTVGGALLVSAGPSAAPNRFVLSNPLMVRVGLISFPLYIWHWPLLVFARILEEGPPPALVSIGALALSFLLASGTYLLVERSFRFGSFERLKTAFLISGMAIVGVWGFAIYKANGIPTRFDKASADAQDLMQILRYPKVDEERCQSSFPPNFLNDPLERVACGVSKNEPPSIALIGDSHSFHYYSAFSKILHQSVINIKVSGCLPFSSNTQGNSGDLASRSNIDCAKRTDVVLQYLRAHQNIKTVYLSGFWSYLSSSGFGEKGANWQFPAVPTPEETSSFTKNGRYFLAKILEMKKKVIVTHDVPFFDFDPNICLKVRPVSLNHDIERKCTISRAKVASLQKTSEDQLAELFRQFPQISTFDPMPLLCDARTCSAMMKGTPLYRDGHHLNPYGAGIVAKALLAQDPPAP